MWIGGPAGWRMGVEGTERLGSKFAPPSLRPQVSGSDYSRGVWRGWGGLAPQGDLACRSDAFDGAAAPSPAAGGYKCRRAGVVGGVREPWPQQGPSSSSSPRALLSPPSRPRIPEGLCSGPPQGCPLRPRTPAPQWPRHVFRAEALGPQRRLPPAWILPSIPKVRPPRRRRSAASARRSARSSCSCWSSSSARPCTPTSTCGSAWLLSRCSPSPGSRCGSRIDGPSPGARVGNGFSPYQQGSIPQLPGLKQDV